MTQDRIPWWKRRLAVLIVGGIAAFALLFTVFREMGVVGIWKLRGLQNQLTRENARLREENARLHQEVERLRTSPAYIEEIARKELGLIGRKENVIVLDGQAKTPPGSPPKGGTGRP